MSQQENDQYYAPKFAGQEAKEAERRAQAAKGLQERTAERLKKAEAARMAESTSRQQREEFRREAEEAIEKHKREVPAKEANAQWRAESEQRIAAAEEQRLDGRAGSKPLDGGRARLCREADPRVRCRRLAPLRAPARRIPKAHERGSRPQGRVDRHR